MKKALLFCLGLLLLTAARLQAAPANVNFASERGVPFNLRFDGRYLTRGGARQVHLDRVTPGVHWAEFQIPLPYGRFINYRTRVFLDPGLETSFVLLTRPGRGPELRKVSAVPLRGGRGGYDGPGYGGGYYGGQSGDYQTNGDDHHNDESYYGDDQPPVNSNGGSYGNGPTGNGGFYPGGGVSYNRTMAPQDVDALVDAVHRQSFDKDKLPLVRQALSETTVQTDDITRLVREMSFESSKLELAKYGADRVADRQNLYRLNDAFGFSSTAREFQEYVAQRRQ